jgi:Cofactor assembly of complex C subunit B
MQMPILSSTALLTALMSVGLLFFIRASTKDRIQVAKLVTSQQGEPLLEEIQQYFTQRSYRLTAVDPATNQVTFEGFVRSSVFLAIFLTGLAAIGLLCVSLMLSFALPDAARFLPALTVLAPIAGLFYWRKSARPERVLLQVETNLAEVGADTPGSEMGKTGQSVLTVTAHRDELAELQRSLSLTRVDEEA